MREYDQLIGDFHDFELRDPNVCVFLGIDRGRGDLPDPSLAAQARDTERARALLARLRAASTEGLDFDERLDLELAALTVERAVFMNTYAFNGRTQAQQKPEAADAIVDGVFMLFINDPRPAAARLDEISSRIQQVPRLLEQMLARLEQPVARWVNIEIEKIEEVPGFFETLSAWGQGESYAGQAALDAAIERANAAIAAYLEGLRVLPTTTSLHIGYDQARELVRLRGIDKSLEELHGIAREFLAETGAIIESLRGALAAKYGLDSEISTADLHSELNRRYAVTLSDGRLESVLERYQAEREKILAFIRERDLFPVFPEQDMKILRTPGFMEPSIPAGAMMPPPPFREGVRTSLVYLTLREDLLDEHTELGIPGMMIHEGIPGHHLQLATASTHPSVVRRHTDAAEHAEGWTTMLEDYMLDQGYMGDLTDEARFIGKRDISRIGARVAIDLYFMTGDDAFLDVGVGVDLSGTDDPFEKAGRLLQAVTGFTPGRVQAELNWYSQERGYPLSYLTGNRMVWELKADVQRAQIGALEGVELDRAFHRVYLQSGNMPMTYLRRVFAHEGLLG